MGVPNKEEIKEKLLDYPLLRQLVCERWFRLAFALFALVFVFLALFLPKIWRVSRADFRPVIRVSGLDLVQAWSLKRTALKATAAGKFDEANYAWESALANNRADPELVRGALRTLLKEPPGREHANAAVHEALWLLKLTQTNVVDMELASQLFNRYKYYDPIIAFAEHRSEPLTPALASAYLKGLFGLGRMEAFDAHWKEFSQKLSSDPEIGLYRAAYLAGWGPPDTVTQAREQLDRAAQDPAQEFIARELKLSLCAHELDAAEYGRVLQKLEDVHEDTFSHHAAYWTLLIATGQKAEAMRLLDTYPNRPASAIEVVELAELYARLDKRDRGLELLQRYVEDFGHAPVFWVTYANLLIDTKRWEDLRKLAFQIRARDGVRDQLSGLSYFLEGRAELAQGREGNARPAFEKAADREFSFPTLGHNVAGQLLHLGYPDLSRKILVELEKPLESELAYWALLFRVADRLKDAELLLKSASRAFALKPNDPMAINNYAAALIINRENPQQAIKLTMQLIAQNPDSLPAVVNHSAALLLNDRPQQAEALLARVSTNGLNRTQLTLLNLDLFETYFSLKDFGRARTLIDQIDPALLYAPQRNWLLKKSRELPPIENKG